MNCNCTSCVGGSWDGRWQVRMWPYSEYDACIDYGLRRAVASVHVAMQWVWCMYWWRTQTGGGKWACGHTVSMMHVLMTDADGRWQVSMWPYSEYDACIDDGLRRPVASVHVAIQWVWCMYWCLKFMRFMLPNWTIHHKVKNNVKKNTFLPLLNV